MFSSSLLSLTFISATLTSLLCNQYCLRSVIASYLLNATVIFTIIIDFLWQIQIPAQKGKEAFHSLLYFHNHISEMFIPLFSGWVSCTFMEICLYQERLCCLWHFFHVEFQPSDRHLEKQEVLDFHLLFLFFHVIVKVLQVEDLLINYRFLTGFFISSFFDFSFEHFDFECHLGVFLSFYWYTRRIKLEFWLFSKTYQHWSSHNSFFSWWEKIWRYFVLLCWSQPSSTTGNKSLQSFKEVQPLYWLWKMQKICKPNWLMRQDLWYWSKVGVVHLFIKSREFFAWFWREDWWKSWWLWGWCKWRIFGYFRMWRTPL